ncbi:hypothetical protein ATN83_3385 [Raoultella ornithinolytica]|jgi:hypothetical protein|nr:hypothetical protein ATN83_3385 [Raoultella ornithinolytica]
MKNTPESKPPSLYSGGEKKASQELAGKVSDTTPYYDWCFGGT